MAHILGAHTWEGKKTNFIQRPKRKGEKMQFGADVIFMSQK